MINFRYMTREEKELRIEQIREILEGMDMDYVANL